MTMLIIAVVLAGWWYGSFRSLWREYKAGLATLTQQQKMCEQPRGEITKQDDVLQSYEQVQHDAVEAASNARLMVLSVQSRDAMSGSLEQSLKSCDITVLGNFEACVAWLNMLSGVLIDSRARGDDEKKRASSRVPVGRLQHVRSWESGYSDALSPLQRRASFRVQPIKISHDTLSMKTIYIKRSALVLGRPFGLGMSAPLKNYWCKRFINDATHVLIHNNVVSLISLQETGSFEHSKTEEQRINELLRSKEYNLCLMKRMQEGLQACSTWTHRGAAVALAGGLSSYCFDEDEEESGLVWGATTSMGCMLSSVIAGWCAEKMEAQVESARRDFIRVQSQHDSLQLDLAGKALVSQDLVEKMQLSRQEEVVTYKLKPIVLDAPRDADKVIFSQPRLGRGKWLKFEAYHVQSY